MIESIVFSLGEINFGITINQVRRLGKPQKIDPIDGAPDWISGISTYKDRVLPYIQFWKILEILPPPKEILLFPYDFDYCVFGISEIRGIFEIEIKEKNSNIFSMPYIMGFGELQDRVIIFVDLKNLLSQKQISIIRQISKKWERITTIN